MKSSQVLVYYDPVVDLVLTCDALSHGVGAVLSHRYKDNLDRPIAFVSRTLAPAEKKYAHIEKEGLAVVFAVKKFHTYLFGRHFEIVSDYEPLKTLFGERSVCQHWPLSESSDGP